jgi:two-component system NtrC family sensor kinase
MSLAHGLRYPRVVPANATVQDLERPPSAPSRVQDTRRILIIDDNAEIHADIRKIMGAPKPSEHLDELDADLFGAGSKTEGPEIQIDSAYQGREGFKMVCQAVEDGSPYCVAIVDMRMPPGWDGVETIAHLLEEDPELQIIICTAFSDYSWAETLEKLGHHVGLLVLKKPFDNVELRQMAHALAEKWILQREVEAQVDNLESQVRQRTEALEIAYQALKKEMTEKKRVVDELSLAQKLESVGRLASGIAHEINTPVQFVSDAVHFVQGAFNDTFPLLERYRALREAAATHCVTPELIADVAAAEEAAEVGFIKEQIPKALESAIDGLGRVATLVRSMKEFAHPDQTAKASADINRALSTTLTIARNEYKYVAEIETAYGEIPQVLCHIGELNQVFLNIIVNAAHAIADAVAGSERRGLIKIATRQEGSDVVIAISDSGNGIPEAIRSKIFDPFFTTKEVGKGTGQGLAIARSVVVDKHGGAISVETEVGHGTTFLIRLPIGEKPV